MTAARRAEVDLDFQLVGDQRAESGDRARTIIGRRKASAVSHWAGAKEQKLLERVRTICLAYAEATERRSHGSPCFYVRDKHSFVMCWDDHHGDGRVALWCAAPGGAQAALIAADPERFFVPPYVGTRGWIGVRIDGKPDWKHVAAVIDEAYHTVADAHRRKA